LKGIRKGPNDDTGKVKATSAGTRGFKLSGTKTKIILEPTVKQSEKDLDVKNPTVAPGDMPGKKGGTPSQRSRTPRTFRQSYPAVQAKEIATKSYQQSIAIGIKGHWRRRKQFTNASAWTRRLAKVCSISPSVI
jgi:hypothetical protein